MNAICIFFFYIYWCSKRLPYHIMFLSFNSSTMGVTSGAGTFYPQIIQGFIPVHVCQSFVFCRVVLPSQGHYGFHSFPLLTDLSVYKLMSFDFSFGRLFGVR